MAPASIFHWVVVAFTQQPPYGLYDAFFVRHTGIKRPGGINNVNRPVYKGIHFFLTPNNQNPVHSHPLSRPKIHHPGHIQQVTTAVAGKGRSPIR